MLLGLGIGLASSFTELYRVSKKALKEEEK